MSSASELAELLRRAEAAPGNERIDLAADIAGHGTEAVAPLSEWLRRDDLGRFASRVIERIAREHRRAAMEVLRAGRAAAPPSVAAEIGEALARLGARDITPVESERTPRQPRTWPSRRLGSPYGRIAGFRLVNTNHHQRKEDDSYMLGQRRAAAFYSPWKERIAGIGPGDVVFLYRNGAGIVAMGQATDRLGKRPRDGHPEEEFYRELDPFQRVDPPASAAEIKDVTGHSYSFRGVAFALDPDAGHRLLSHLTGERTSRLREP